MTEKEFPVANGTKISVSCREPLANLGSDTVTCNTYVNDDFSYKNKPSCILPEEGRSIIGRGTDTIILKQYSNLELLL